MLFHMWNVLIFGVKIKYLFDSDCAGMDLKMNEEQYYHP